MAESNGGGLTLNTAPLVPIRFIDQKGEEVVYWVQSDFDPILYYQCQRWFTAYRDFRGDEKAVPPNYDDLYRMTGRLLGIEPESARAYGSGNCIRVLDFLFGLWLSPTTIEPSSVRPSKSRRRSPVPSPSAT